MQWLYSRRETRIHWPLELNYTMHREGNIYKIFKSYENSYSLIDPDYPRTMQHVHILLFITAVSLSLSSSLVIKKNSTRATPNDNGTVPLPHDKRPVVIEVIQPAVGSSRSAQHQCSPKPYRVRLWNGNCSLPVITQVWYYAVFYNLTEGAMAKLVSIDVLRKLF